MSEEAAKLPPAVQRSVDAANAAAHKAGLKNAPDPKAPQGEASPAAMQASLDAAEPPRGDNVTPLEPKAPKANWEHEARTWRGRYEAEVPQMRGELETLRQQLAQMQGLVQQPATAKPADEDEPKVQGADGQWYTPAQLEDFGQDFFDLVDRRVGMVETRYEKTLTTLQEENEGLKAKLAELGQGVQKVQQAPLFTVLDERIPEWKQMNSDPAFIQWAKETPVSDLDDKPMLAALRNLFSAGRVEGVIKIFQAYQQSNTQGAQSGDQPQHMQPPYAPQGSQPPAASAPQLHADAARPPVDLDSLAGPGASQEAFTDPAAGAPTRVWTDAGIASFYDQARRGTITPGDVAKLEADLQQAISPAGRRAGRYRPR